MFIRSVPRSYELLTLQPAVGGSDRQEIFHEIVDKEPAPLRRLNPAVPVDLATITAKALAKDPAQRYETAWHFADDLARYLDGRPIAARPVGPLARTWRWCRRKPALASLILSLAIALALGSAGITWSWREAVRERRESRRQAARAEAINRFLIDKILSEAEPETNPDAKRLTLLEVVDRASAEVGSSLHGQPETEAAIRMALGKAYHGLAEYAKSEEHYQAACHLLDQSKQPTREAIEARERGHLLAHLDRNVEAETILRHARTLARERLSLEDDVSLNLTEYLATACQSLKKIDEAVGLSRDILEIRRRINGPKSDKTANAMNNLGVLLAGRGSFDKAEVFFRECLKVNRETLPANHISVLKSLFNLGFVAAAQGRTDEGERLIRESVETGRKFLGEENSWTLYWSSQLGDLLKNAGRLDEAEAILRPCLEAQRPQTGPGTRQHRTDCSAVGRPAKGSRGGHWRDEKTLTETSAG